MVYRVYYFSLQFWLKKKNAKQNKTKNQKQKRLKLLHNNSSGTEKDGVWAFISWNEQVNLLSETKWTFMFQPFF